MVACLRVLPEHMGEHFCEESARMYEKAYKICEDNKMLEGYLYASSRSMPQDEYQKMDMGNEILLKLTTNLQKR